tara:strand:- start:2816 stop:2989 length:174 start_codon:yes stop_codon:yes gene_type:complete
MAREDYNFDSFLRVFEAMHAQEARFNTELQRGTREGSIDLYIPNSVGWYKKEYIFGE